ncbi:unnamed protein product [Paramecium sonneborni]|uniref:Transmembrane protein n=1 Tax=Paramecium sonneborni TaxID=65129 RepID=A0A8S1L5V7_9CILI|nr:unnamed protein product [Paramecium sonneborni]
MIRIYLLLIPLIYGCTKFPNDTIYIVSTPGEIIEQSPSYIFDEILNLESQYKISPPSEFVSIIESSPIDLIKQSEYTLSLNKEIIQQKLYKSAEYDSTQHWSFLSKAENKYFVEYNSEIFGFTPQIDVSQQLNLKENSTCYDVVQLLKLHVIECSNAEGDYFAILEKESVLTMQIQNSTNPQRKIDQLDDVLIRSLTNYIEVYQLQQDNKLVLKGNLTTEILQKLLLDDLFYLEIVDFKFHQNSIITILNQQGQFLELEYNLQSNEWEKNWYLRTQIDKPYGYDYIVDKNNELFYWLAIISDTFILCKKTSESGTFEWTIDNLKNDINSKVYISFMYYLLLQNEKSLSLYSIKDLNRIKIEWSINLEGKTFVHQYIQFSSFLLFIQPYFYAYNYVQKYQRLQFSSKELINENMHFILEVTNQFQITCRANIYFKVVDKSSTEIYQTLLAPQIFCSRDEQRLNDYCGYIQQYQGFNIQLEFDHNEALDLNYNLTIPFELQIKEDPEQVIYRKIINYNPYFVLIEQNKNMELQTYECRSFINYQPQLCQKLFDLEDEFVELIDSPLQSWYYDSNSFIVFALAHDKQVDIYRNQRLKITFQVNSMIKQIFVGQEEVWLIQENQLLGYSLDYKKKTAQLKFQSSNNIIPIQFWFQIGNVLTNLITDQRIELHNDGTVIDLIDENLFFILMKKNDQYFGYIYDNYSNQENDYPKRFILFKKEIDLSKYQEVTIVNQENCKSYFGSRKYIYLKALRDGIPVILLYRPEQNFINSQYLELKISQNTQISTCDKLLFLTDKSNQNLQQHLIIDNFKQVIHGKLNQEQKQIQFQQTLNLSGRIFNQFNSYKLEQIPVNLFNRGTELFAIVHQFNFTYEKDGQKTQCYNLGQSWYSGQAFEIDLKEPIEDVEYVKTLIKQTETILYSESIMEYDSNTLVQLINNKIVLVSKANFESIEFPLGDQYIFNEIMYIYDDLIYVGAENSDTKGILCLIKCKDYNCQLQDGCLELGFINKIYYLNQNHMFMKWSSQYIFIYDTNGDPSKIFQFKYIGFQQMYQYSNFIEVSQLFENIYLIASINQECQLNFINLKVTDSLTLMKVQYFNLKNVEPIFNNPKSQCGKILVKKDQIFVSGQGQPIVIFKLEKQCDQNYCLMQIKFKSLIQVYGGHEIVEDQLNENIYSIHYVNTYKQKLGVLFYDITDDFTNLQPNLAIAHLPTQNSPLIVYNYNGQLHLLKDEGYYILQHFILKRSSQICTTKPQNKDVQFILKNTYNQVTVQIKLNITQVPPDPVPPGPDPPGPNPPGPDPTPEDKKGFSQWLFWSIGGGIVLGVGIGITIWCCKKKKAQIKKEKLIPL